MGFAWRIAWRYFSTKRRTSFISLIAFLSIGGIAIGVTALIVVLGVMSGFDQKLFDTVMGATSDVVVSREGGILNWADVVDEVLKVDGVVAAAPFFHGQVLLRSEGQVLGAAIRGLAPGDDGTVTDFYTNLERGVGTLDPDGIVLGQELAYSLRVNVGDEIDVISPYFISTPRGEVPLRKRMTISGLTVSGMYEYDSTFCYVELAMAQRLFGVEDTVAGVEVRLADPYRADTVAAAIAERLEYRYDVRSWMDLNRTYIAALRHEKVIMAIILILILLVAAFNIASTLVMVVMEKTKDIGILKTIGVSAGQVQVIFLLVGGIVGSLGLALGNIGGIVLSRNLNALVDFLERRFGIGVFPADIYYFDEIPVLISPMEVLAVNVFALIVTLAASWYPAWHAARLHPVDSLRYE